MDEPDGIQEELKAEGYMDDIMPYGETREECCHNTIRVLKKLSYHGLGLNPEKCKFEQEEVDFLGFVMGHGKISMDPVKVEGLSKWPTPKTLKELQSFLGFGNFYCRFIKGYSGIASPLHALQGKDVAFIWTKECDDAFETLKTRFTSYSAPLMPNPTRPFQIEADASKYVMTASFSFCTSSIVLFPVHVFLYLPFVYPCILLTSSPFVLFDLPLYFYYGH